MKAVENRSWRTFQALPGRPWFKGLRGKSLRHEGSTPSGRAKLTLFTRPECDIAYARHARWMGGETYLEDHYIKYVDELSFCAVTRLRNGGGLEAREAKRACCAAQARLRTASSTR